MIGTEEKDLFQDKDIKNDDIIDDLDYDYVPDAEGDASYVSALSEEYKHKLDKYSDLLNITLIHPIRKDKKLLVLDLDYTLFDMKGKSEDYLTLKRPYTDEFLTAMYKHYEIVVWSQTSWRWLELKLTELKMLENPNYKLCFVLDKTCMFSIKSKMSDGNYRKHHVKPLELIWRKYPQWGPHNTVHVDDLGRNFALNPYNGLKISAYKNTEELKSNDPASPYFDRELLFLQVYLEYIKDIKHFAKELKLSRWKEVLQTEAAQALKKQS